MRVRITQLDGRLPNLALMRLTAWHRERGDEVHFYRGAGGLARRLDEPAYDRVYADVPAKEGKPQATGTVAQIWRGAGWPKHIHLLDNDFFGVPKPVWKARLAEIRDGGFRVAFNQGINIRVVTDEIAAELASVEYRDDQFRRRRLYTAWDSLHDGDQFFKGVARLERAGIPPRHLLVFMLVGHAPGETWADVFCRFNRMVELGIRPYPMPYQGEKRRRLPLGGFNQRIEHKTLGEFQRWVALGLYRAKGKPFEAYDVNAEARVQGQPDLFSR